MDKTARIRELNDTLRTTFTGGRVMLSAGVAALGEAEQAAVCEKVRTFSDFNSDNDPHREHDLASVEHGDEWYFGKIDYYAPDMQCGSKDPADPTETIRVLTIMRADEY